MSNVIGLTTTAIDEARNPLLKTALKERGQPVLEKLSDCRALLLEAGNFGDGNNHNTNGMTSKLPPLAFEIARETKVCFFFSFSNSLYFETCIVFFLLLFLEELIPLWDCWRAMMQSFPMR